MSLSDKRITKFYGKKHQSYYTEEDVKKLIEKLKEKWDDTVLGRLDVDDKKVREVLNKQIDKLSGDKLI